MKTQKLWKLLTFTVLAVMIMCIGCIAIAEAANPCSGGQHRGPYRYNLISAATCTVNGSQEKFCMACGEKIGVEPIIAIGHQFEASTRIITPATCTTDGLRQVQNVCRVCGYQDSIRDEVVPAHGHNYGAWSRIKAPTCEEAGTEERVCSYDYSHRETRQVAATGHNYGAWFVSRTIDCEVAGEETRICSNNPAHRETRPVAATGHRWDTGRITKEPTCTTQGVRTITCLNNPAHIKTEPVAIAPDAHQWDGGKITKAPNCTEPGTRVYTCKLNPAHTKSESIAINPNAHQWDEGKVTVAPGCETAGQKVYTCKLNPAHTKTETLNPTGHKWDKGTVTKPATLTETGVRHFVCQNNHEHTMDKTIPRISFNNNTLCAFGPRLRDVNLYPYDTDLWYMFTPIDVSQDGQQTFDMVVSNTYIVGTLTITVKEGFLTVDYKLNGNSIDVTTEFFTILHQIDDIHQYEPEQLMAYRMNVKQPINLAEHFGDDRNLVLYFCSRCDYQYNSRFIRLNYDSPTHQAIVHSMLSIMDTKY